MKKIISLVLFLSILTGAFAQTTDWSKANLANQAGDHFMVQFSSDHWANVPDSISSHQKGFSRGLNIYFMINKRFKNDPRWSIAFGLGVGSSNIFFNASEVTLNAAGSTLPFPNDSSTDHFKKYKLATSYLDIPIELRYTAHPEKQNKSWKFAIGAKVGFMLDAHTKGKTLVDQYGNLIDDYTEKISSTSFFNTTRLCGTARIGYGSLSVFTSWQVTSFLRQGAGPGIIPYQVGLCISGL
jgi:hypothetical protein